ncbi:hypothetical protein BN2476_340038 [Paraburkholderia piptadeniae]|uniref:Uncharacterized protein n=1 Tax=Paraburkholderia piptadeniae TaxID=1701573 RepID=A0A1N7S6T5_9BURK|nr:hypothetical protein BN2476_340038 [Paraburkholderia piptadeniae]
MHNNTNPGAMLNVGRCGFSEKPVAARFSSYDFRIVLASVSYRVSVCDCGRTPPSILIEYAPSGSVLGNVLSDPAPPHGAPNPPAAGLRHAAPDSMS